MDWNLAMGRNREALKRIVAMLVAMAGLDALASPLAGEDGSARRGEAEPSAEPGKGCFSPAPTLPRHLHRAVLLLLRPAEAAVRRLVIVVARGLVVPLPPVRPRDARPSSAVARSASRKIAFQLLDPIRPFPAEPGRSVANGFPRISLPGVTALAAVPPRRTPAPDDPLDATRLVRRIEALDAALDDLPRQARRFARWRLQNRRNRDAAGAQDQKTREAAGMQRGERRPGRIRRVWPLRPGRPPGQRPHDLRGHEVYEILHDLHGLAFDVLERSDTS